MRARNLKPGFFKNSKLGKMPIEARVLFAGLWCMADGLGRLEDDPDKIKIEILPYDDCDINSYLNILANCKDPFIIRYKTEKCDVIQICNWHHQNPHPSEKAKGSAFPEYRENSRQVSEKTLPEMLIPDSCFLNPDVLKPEASEKNLASPEPAATPLSENSISVWGQTYEMPLVIVDTKTGREEFEPDWLLKQLIAEMKAHSSGRVSTIEPGLKGFLKTNPMAEKIGRCWLATPLENRMASLAYAASQPNVIRELSYAIKAIQENWEGYAKLIPKARESIKQHDYRIEL